MAAPDARSYQSWRLDRTIGLPGLMLIAMTAGCVAASGPRETSRSVDESIRAVKRNSDRPTMEILRRPEEIASVVTAHMRVGDDRFLVGPSDLAPGAFLIPGLSSAQLKRVGHSVDLTARVLSLTEMFPFERDHTSYRQAEDDFDRYLATYNRRLFAELDSRGKIAP